MDAFNWLHLTDLHWGLTGQKPLWSNIREQFFKDLEAPAGGPLFPPEVPIEQLTARVLGNHHQAAQRDWDDRWSGVIGQDRV